jgi:hypothetical protein
MWKIVIGLVCVMIANILLGAKLADLKDEFKWSKVWAGLFKSACVTLSAGLMYICSYYNPNIMIANINGINVNLISAMEALFIAGIIMYGYQDLNKLQAIIKTKVVIKEAQEDSITDLDKEDEEV